MLHLLKARFTSVAQVQVGQVPDPDPVRIMIIERMANVLRKGMLGVDPVADAEARFVAADTFDMVEVMVKGLSDSRGDR